MPLLHTILTRSLTIAYANVEMSSDKTCNNEPALESGQFCGRRRHVKHHHHWNLLDP